MILVQYWCTFEAFWNQLCEYFHWFETVIIPFEGFQSYGQLIDYFYNNYALFFFLLLVFVCDQMHMRFNYQFYWCILITWIFEMVLEKSYITNWGLRIRKLVMKCKKYLLIFRQESLVGKVPKYAISPSWFVYRQLAFFPSFCASSRNWILNWQKQIYIYIYMHIGWYFTVERFWWACFRPKS